MDDRTPLQGSAQALPAEVTNFVGRRHERSEVKRLLSQSRLVTLTGCGGVGKTRLALAVVSDLRRAFPDGVWFVSLEEVRDPALLAPAVEASLGMHGRSTRAASPALVEHLKRRDLLLVLDNCEHLVDVCAVLTDTLLRTCPRLRVLTTSREPLRIRGETVCPVVPLTVPGDDDGIGVPLPQYESIALFIDRAQSVLPNFALTDENRDAVANICRRLDGIPLAIELAVARLQAMSPQEFDERLSHRWQLLNVGSRSAPDRQQTMDACIEWSYELCSDAERDLWARVSIFSGGFELDAVEAICADTSEEARSIPDLILSLVQKSILFTEQHDGRIRYRLLEVIRQRGIRRLRQLGENIELRRKHRDWYRKLAARAESDWVGSQLIELLPRLRRERANFQAAVDFCYLEPGEAEAGLMMVASLENYLLCDGLFRLGRQWLDRLLARAPKPTSARGYAIRTAYLIALMQGDFDAATEFLKEGRELAGTLGKPVTTLMTQAAGIHATFAGELNDAVFFFESALTEFHESGDHTQVGRTLVMQAISHAFLGNLEHVLACHDECLLITERAGGSWMKAYSSWISGLAMQAKSDSDAAIKLEKQALRLMVLMNDQLGIALCLEALAWIKCSTDAVHAATLLGAADKIWKEIETSTEILPALSAYHGQCEDFLHRTLSDRQYAKALHRGAGLDQQALNAYALDEPCRDHTAGSSSQRPDVHNSGPLTKRESQIAQLVANGMTNKDIANSLVISKRTAETHVEHILAKLGFTSRNQIAPWISAQQEQAGEAASSGPTPDDPYRS